MPPDDIARVPVGYVRRAHGLRGDCLVRSLSDDADRFVVGARFSSDEQPARSLTVAEVRPHAEGILLRFKQISSRTAAEAMRGVTLTIGADERRQLAEDEFWPEDLEGLTAMDVAGHELGPVTAVITGGSQDRLVVAASGGDVEVPFVAAIVTDVDIDGGHVTMDPPPGLFGD